jgi:N,N'-diacetyllegionaminate synthase
MKDKYTYIIAEIGPNHNGSLKRAIDLVKNLSKIGVDAVKFQVSKLENAYSKDAFKPKYQRENDSEKSPLDMSRKFQLPFEDHIVLSKVCKENGVDYMCTAFEMESLFFLTNNIDMPYYKIPSGEILTLDILEHIAVQKRPIILSTGMASYEEMAMAIEVLKEKGNNQITILHCISNYPVPAEDVNLNVMLEIQSRFQTPVGFSDHTIGNDAAIAAVALGATIIEKHVTFDKNAEGPDHKASSSVSEFAELVKSIRNVDKMMGSRKKMFSKDELEVKKSARKSIVTKRELKKGHMITREDLCFKRPGFGFSPFDLNEVLGKELLEDIEANRVILKEHFE